MKGEKQRLISKREQILNVLRSAGNKGVTNAELSVTALRYGGYLGDLYKLGYKIDTESLGDGLFKYTLISEPESLVKREKAIDTLLSEIENRGGMISQSDLLNILDSKGIAVKYKANTYKA